MPTTNNKAHAPFLVLAALAALPALAEPDAGLSENLFLDAPDEVVTPSRLPQSRLLSPAAVTVIDRQMIESSGIVDIAELFRLAPGMLTGDVRASFPSVTALGLADQYSRGMQVLIDGRSIYLPSFGGVAWEDLPLSIDDIERIEIVRGPNAAHYGSNSFLGVINIQTRHPAQVAGTTARVTRGQDDLAQGYLRQAGHGAATDYRVNVEWRHSDGFQHFNDDYSTRLVNTRVEHRLTPHDRLDGELGYSDGRHAAGDPDPSELDPTGNDESWSHFEYLTWEHRTTGGDALTLRASNNYRKDDDLRTVTLVPGFPGRNQLGVRARRSDLELEHRLRLSRALRAVWGAGYRQDHVDSRFWLGTGPKQNGVSRLFANGEWTVTDDWILHSGAMLEHSDLTGTDVQPRVAVVRRIGPQHALRAAVSRATRMPLLFEEQADTVADLGVAPLPLYLSSGGLDPERIVSWEVGFACHHPEYALDFDVRVHHDEIRDYIWAIKTPGTASQDFTNVGRADIDGIETQVEWRPTPAWRLQLMHALNDIKVNIRNDDIAPGDADELTDDLEDSVPDQVLGALAAWRPATGWELSGGWYYSEAVNWLDAGATTSPMRRLDLKLARELPFPDGRLRLSVTGQNIAEDHQDFDDRNVRDERIFFTAEWRTR